MSPRAVVVWSAANLGVALTSRPGGGVAFPERTFLAEEARRSSLVDRGIRGDVRGWARVARWAWMTLSLLLLSGVDVARAHGPAPAVLDVLALRDGAPWLLRTNVGLAEAGCDPRYGYRTFAYLCPSLWTGNELARSFALADGRVVVLDLGELHLSSPSRDELARDEQLAAWQVRDVAIDGATLWVLAREREGERRSVILRHGEPTRWPLPVHPDHLEVVAGEVWAVASDPPTLCRLDACEPLPLEAADRVAIRGGDADAIWLLVTTETRTLGRLRHATGGFEPGPSGELVLGPIAHAGRTIAVVDGVVWEHAPSAGPSAWTPTGARRDEWTCLTQLEGRTFACSLEGLFAVDDDLGLTPVFRFAQLAPPREAHEDACALDWAHFGGESRWLDAAPAGSPEGTRGEDVPPDPSCRAPSGCAAAGAPSTLFAPLFVALLALYTQRRRPTPRGPTPRGPTPRDPTPRGPTPRRPTPGSALRPAPHERRRPP